LTEIDKNKSNLHEKKKNSNLLAEKNDKNCPKQALIISTSQKK
jgi:hypothetical protein